MAAAVPFVMLAMSVAGTAYSVFQQNKAGEQRAAADTRAAEQARTKATQLYEDTEQQHRRIIARQRAIYGASGLTEEGSPLLVRAESLKESKEQLRRITEAGANQSAAYLEEAQNALDVGKAEGIKSILGGVGSAYSIGRSYNWW